MPHCYSILHVKANTIFAKLFVNNSEDNVVIREEEEEHLYMSEQFDRVVAESTNQHKLFY